MIKKEIQKTQKNKIHKRNYGRKKRIKSYKNLLGSRKLKTKTKTFKD